MGLVVVVPLVINFVHVRILSLTMAENSAVAAASGGEETKRMCMDMFTKVSEYVNGELSGETENNTRLAAPYQYIYIYNYTSQRRVRSIICCCG